MKLAAIANNADFWSGVMFVGFGATAVYLSRDYPMGTAIRMGPGYFPHYLGLLMIAMGIAVAVKGFVTETEPIERWSLRPLLTLGIGIVLFGLAVEPIGFVPALAILIVASALAGREFKLLEVLLLSAALIAGAVGVFIYGIGLPYQLFWWN